MNRLVHAISFGVVAAIGLIILIVAIATVSWVVVVEDDVGASNSVTPGKRVRQVGLFQVCTEGSCEVDENYLHIAVQVLSLISTLAQLAGIICHIIKECHQRHPHLVHWVAAFFSIAAGAMFTAMSIYSSIYHPHPSASFGYSFVLGWVSFAASFVLAVVAVVKAIKEAESIKGDCNCNCC